MKVITQNQKDVLMGLKYMAIAHNRQLARYVKHVSEIIDGDEQGWASDYIYSDDVTIKKLADCMKLEVEKCENGDKLK